MLMAANSNRMDFIGGAYWFVLKMVVIAVSVKSTRGLVYRNEAALRSRGLGLQLR